MMGYGRITEWDKKGWPEGSRTRSPWSQCAEFLGDEFKRCPTKAEFFVRDFPGKDGMTFLCERHYRVMLNHRYSTAQDDYENLTTKALAAQARWEQIKQAQVALARGE